jgi:hypothetical protein
MSNIEKAIKVVQRLESRDTDPERDLLAAEIAARSAEANAAELAGEPGFDSAVENILRITARVNALRLALSCCATSTRVLSPRSICPRRVRGSAASGSSTSGGMRQDWWTSTGSVSRLSRLCWTRLDGSTERKCRASLRRTSQPDRRLGPPAPRSPSGLPTCTLRLANGSETAQQQQGGSHA